MGEKTTAEKGRASVLKIALWLAAGVIAVNLYRGLTVERIGIPGVFEIQFGKHAAAHRNESAAPGSAPGAGRDGPEGDSRDPGRDGVPEAARESRYGPAPAPGGLTGNRPVQEKPSREFEKRQVELEEKIARLEEKLGRSRATRDPQGEVEGPDGKEAAAQGSPGSSRAPSIQGQWRSREGAAYAIQQYGSQITIQEINPVLGVTAAGQGTFRGETLEVAYTTVYGTAGSLFLELSPDGNRLRGNYTDLTTGFSQPLVLNR